MKAAFALALVLAALSTGCGTALTPTNYCTSVAMRVVPPLATADHSASAPENQIKFSLQFTDPPGNCVLPTSVPVGTWKASDPLNVSISSAADATNGLTTCMGSTTGTVVVSSSLTPLTATIVCK